MDSSSNRQPAPQRRKPLATAWLWIIIGICVVVLAWMLLRPPAAQPSIVLFEASNQSGSLLYSKAPQFLASGTVQIDYSVASCNHNADAGWDVLISLVWIMQTHPEAFGPVWTHRASCGDAGTATFQLDSAVCCPSSEGAYAPAVSSPGSGVRWSLKITQL